MRSDIHSLKNAVLALDVDGGWDTEKSNGWPDANLFRNLQQAVLAGYVEQSSAYGNMCWRLTDEGIEFRKNLLKN